MRNIRVTYYNIYLPKRLNGIITKQKGTTYFSNNVIYYLNLTET